MKWASAVYEGSDSLVGFDEVVRDVAERMGEARPDLVLLFVTPHFRGVYARVSAMVRAMLPGRVLAGCSAMGVIGAGREIEQAPGISLVAAQLPDVEIHAICSDASDLPDEDAPPMAWQSWLGLPGADVAGFILLADPFSAPVERVVTGMDYAFPAAPKIGGLASGGGEAMENVLFLNDQLHRRGLVVIGLRGNLVMDTIVAQGCRPIGRPLTVTGCGHNILFEVDGQSPVAYLQTLLPTLPAEDRKLAEVSLFLGLEMDPLRHERGGYLIRNLIGVDYGNGAVAVGAALHEGMVVQFHLRDRFASAQDLLSLLRNHRERVGGGESAALLFSCLGRGEFLYGRKNHDSDLFTKVLGDPPLGGFFCNGEIGPVGATTYVHGYTSAFGLFRPRTAPR